MLPKVWLIGKLRNERPAIVPVIEKAKVQVTVRFALPNFTIDKIGLQRDTEVRLAGVPCSIVDIPVTVDAPRMKMHIQ